MIYFIGAAGLGLAGIYAVAGGTLLRKGERGGGIFWFGLSVAQVSITVFTIIVVGN